MKVIFILIFSIILSLIYNPLKVLAESPIFEFKEIKDPFSDWKVFVNNKPSLEGLPLTDINSVDYSSDGKILNAVIWVNAPINSRPTEYAILNYGMYIDSDFDKRTGWYGGIDYKLEIGWNDDTKTWTKTLEKWSAHGGIKTITKENNYNYTKSFEKEKYFAGLTLDLKLLDYPSKYKVTFYAEAKKNKNSSLITDLTKWVAIPPLQLTITTSPSVIELNKDKEKNIEIKINSSQGYEPQVDLSAKSQTNNIETFLYQNKTLHIPTYGMASTPLTIKALPNSTSGPYTLIIFANTTFPPEQLLDDINKNNISNFIQNTSQNVLVQSTIIVTILDPPTWDENLKHFWDNIGGLTSFLYGILAGLTPWIYNSIKNKRKKEKK
jgi:hypothetical protein